MVQLMLSLWSLFIEFLGSYSRCRVSNGVMPCVLGPTNFYLKNWVNILTIIMLCFQDEHQNVVVFFIRMLIFMMFFIWVHQWWMYDEFLGLFNAFHKICSSFILKKLLLHMHQKVAGQSRIKLPNLHWTLCRRERIVDLQLQAHASRRFAWFWSEDKSISEQDLLLLCLLTFHQLHCS